MSPRLTTPVRIVLAALRASERPVYGLDLARTTDIGTSTLYPLLHRLENAGWVTGTDETGPHPGRPPRRYWAITERAPQP